MNRFTGQSVPGLLLLLLSAIATNAVADGCNSESFSSWLKGVRQEAAAEGISKRSIRELDGMTYNPKVIAMDRKQGVFAQTFLKFAGRMVSKYRMTHGKKHMKKYANLFGQLESEYGVPAPVIIAFWALETDFGANTGNFDTLRSLATLAHDCRRPELFRPQLISALKILDMGYLSKQEMKGAWAGELGQTQFLPSDYLKHGLDADGDGRINLLTSKPDVLASTAKHLAHYGWRRGEPWLEEVKVPAKLDWEQANLNNMLPRSTWVEWGVKKRGGELPADGLEASLLLPMGKDGPAFLAYQNFRIYTEWNKSLVYATTAAYLGTRLNGAPPVSKGRDTIAYLTLGETKQLQTILKSKGYDVGKVDGVIGANTRASVRLEQKRLGMAADGYPTKQLLRRLTGNSSDGNSERGGHSLGL
jgi:lytic murein transglycosylase